MTKLPAVHPGGVLLEEFLVAAGQAQYDLDVEADRLGDRRDHEVTTKAS
jgi:hypothetical protein